MPISFGSVGDIISICLLVKDLIAALDDSRGAASEYQQLRRELYTLDRALLEVELLSRCSTPSIKLNALYATTRKAAIDCRQPIETFLEKIKKYDHSLGDSGPRNLVRDAAMKLRWQVTQKDEVIKLRAQINAQSSSINMLLATANVALAQENHQELSNKVSEAERRNQIATDGQSAILIQVRDRLKETNALLSVANSVTTKLKNTLKLEWFSQLGNELKSMMRKIITINVSTYQTVLAIQGNLSGSLGRSLIQEPFILEDAIGRMSPVHLQFISSWEMFDAVLDLRFRNVQGHKKILGKEYILQEHATRREINRARPWDGAFLPGQRIEMSLIFNSENRKTTSDETTSCPACQKNAEGPQEAEILCNNCGIWYRRITEFFDVEPPSFESMAVPRRQPITAQFGKPSFNNVSYGPKRPSRFPALSPSVKRKVDTSELEEDDMRQFKRIRLISKIDRVKHKPGPFSQHASKESILNPTQKWLDDEEQTAWENYYALKTSLGDFHSDTLSSLNSLARKLRNRSKYSTAEELIRGALVSVKEELLAHSPESLQLILCGLMTVLVDQGKLEAAEELWQSSIELFRIRVGGDSANALQALFRQAYPLRRQPLMVIKSDASSVMELTPDTNENSLTSLPDSFYYSIATGGNIPSFEALQKQPQGETYAHWNVLKSYRSPIRQTDNDVSPTPLPALPAGFVGFNSNTNNDSTTGPTAHLQDEKLKNEPIPKSLVGPQGEEGSPTHASSTALHPRVIKNNYSLDNFDILRTIGTGSFARVHLVQSRINQRFYAIKVFKKAQVVRMKQVEHMKDERIMLANIKHPFIITLWGTFQDSDRLYMINDFVEGGELFSLLRRSQRFPDPVAKFYAAEIILAISYLHRQNIIYRDIKPENILLDRHGHLKLCDFGFAKRVSHLTWTLCGTPDYLAPEVVNGKGYNKSVDWWGLGIFIYEMLCGYTPFWDGASPMKIYENILQGRIKYPRRLHPDAKDLLKQLLTADLTRRLGNLHGGSEDVKNHKWFAEVAWDQLLKKDVDAPYYPPIKAGTGDASQFDKYSEETEPYGQEGHDEYGHLFEDF